MIYYVSNTPQLFPSDNMVTATIEDALEYFRSHETVQLDTETSGLDFLTDRILLVQLGDKNNQFVINAECDFLRFKPLLESRNVLKILHNAKFDYKFLRRKGITLENVYDTMLVEQILNTGRESVSFGLSMVVSKYIGTNLDKDIRETFIGHSGVITDQQIIYSANDVVHLEDIMQKQMEKVKELKLKNVVSLENQAVLAFGDIEYNGMGIDRQSWLKNAEKVLADVREMELKLDHMVVEDPVFGFKGTYYQPDLFKPQEEIRRTQVNWNSSSQVLDVLRKVVPSLESVGKEVLYPVRRKHPLIVTYLDYKKKQKLYNSYGPAFLDLVHSDGRVHPDFRQILNTGRVSCNNPNMQQIPSTNDFRNCFVPGIKDYVFVSSDYASQELCVIAYGSGDPVWLEALQLKQDLHSICAEQIFGRKWHDAAEQDCAFFNQSKSKCSCKEHKKLRDLAKTINFGLAYGMSAYKLADRTEISVPEAERLISKYFSVFPRIKFFLNSLGAYGKRKGHIKTYPPFNRIRWFEQWSEEMEPKLRGEIERASMNTPIQGSSADMTKLALVYARRSINGYKLPVQLVMTVHDQIDTIAHRDFAVEWRGKLEEIMELAALQVIRNGLLKADTNISLKWEK